MTQSGNTFVFEYPLAHLITEGISDEFVTRVALPEGASILKVETSGNRAEITEDKTFSYLDFLGRPTVVVTMKNHIPQAIEGNLRITYKFSKVNLLIEPLYIVAGIFGTFLTTIVIGRMNLDFKKE
jgi:oligosaccharyltransferase complex subunit alpha (ribophorin I)